MVELHRGLRLQLGGTWTAETLARTLARVADLYNLTVVLKNLVAEQNVRQFLRTGTGPDGGTSFENQSVGAGTTVDARRFTWTRISAAFRTGAPTRRPGMPFHGSPDWTPRSCPEASRRCFPVVS